MRIASFVTCLVLTLASSAALSAPPPGEGAKTFTARPKFGATVFELPAAVRWRSTLLPGGRYRVSMDASVNVAPIVANIRALSARALDRDIPCATLVRVQHAAATITSARSVRYDLRFRYAKRVCAGGLPLEFPADVRCAATIALFATGSTLAVDVRGATAPPCRIEGASAALSQAIYGLVGIDVFKRHIVNLAKLLPREFQGATVDIRAFAFDPTRAELRIASESTMSEAQFAALMVRLNSPA